ncbi:MAG TPA: hypothetical protein VLL97_05780 [Acidobacteriota bacterium]|nr:hypothetical protein [Acidobacteriota bacterium]
MKSNGALLTITFLVLTVSYAGSQSLGELAEKERERRNKIQEYRVITDEEAAKFISIPEMSKIASIPSESEKNRKSDEHGNEPTEAVSKPDPDEPVDFQGRPESFWRRTMSEARQRVRELENEEKVLILRINELQDRFFKQSDGFHRETIQRELQKSYYEQDLNKENLAKAKAGLQDLENEARKSGALPGWIDDRR